MAAPVTFYPSILLNATYPKINLRDDIPTSYERHLNDTYSEDLEHAGYHLPSGSYRDSLYIVVPVTVIYASIFLTGIIGNISTCIVIARNKSMHTATNYYLFSLAVSDLLLLVSGLPAEMYMVWCKYPYIFGETFCVLRGLASETSTNATVLTIAAFTVERYVAICHPFLSQTLSKLSRAIRLILVIWLVALSFALPQALQFGVVRYSGHPDMVMCTVKRVIVSHSFELSTFLFFVMPMCLITVLYALIGLKLRNSNMMKNMSPDGRTDSAMRNSCRHHPGGSSRRVLKMLVAVVIAFFICWAPFHVQRLVAIYGTNTEDHITSNGPWMEFLYLLMTYVSGVLYYVSTTINPILYNIMSNKFRMAFMETLAKSCRVPGLRRSHHEQRSYSSLSRSQQRTIGIYGSKIVRASGMAVDSNETSGNSNHEASQKQTSSMINNAGDLLSSTDDVLVIDMDLTRKKYIEGMGNNNSMLPTTENANSNLQLPNEDVRYDKVDRSINRMNQETSWSTITRYETVRVSNIDDNGKKWWRLLKWLPNLKSLKFSRRRSTVPENHVLDELSNHREEFCMTMWKIHDDQRPV